MTNKDTISAWSEAINFISIKQELYYLREDTKMLKPYKVQNISKHFDTDKEYVQFYPIRTDEPQNYVLEKDEFIKRFKQVIEES